MSTVEFVGNVLRAVTEFFGRIFHKVISVFRSRYSIYNVKYERLLEMPLEENQRAPLFVKFHFVKACNSYYCYCLDVAKTDNILPGDDIIVGLTMLRKSGTQNVTFAGGEPFLVDNGTFIGEIVKRCKLDLCYTTISIVTNGTIPLHYWMQEYGLYLDELIVTCDSFEDETNSKMFGEGSKRRGRLEVLMPIRCLCSKYDIKMYISTFVCLYNSEEDMIGAIQALSPDRWLLYRERNFDAPTTKRIYANEYEFRQFIRGHRNLKYVITICNEKINVCDYMLDEYMRFVSYRTAEPSKSILEVGVPAALRNADLNEKVYISSAKKA